MWTILDVEVVKDKYCYARFEKKVAKKKSLKGRTMTRSRKREVKEVSKVKSYNVIYAYAL